MRETENCIEEKVICSQFNRPSQTKDEELSLEEIENVCYCQNLLDMSPLVTYDDHVWHFKLISQAVP